MAILISNEQDLPVDEGRLIKVAEHALAAEGVNKESELSIALVGEEEIRELNIKYRGKDYAADVLSFPSGMLEDEIDEMPCLLGDVVICPSVAARQAKEYGQSFEQEMDLLLVHGILHLLGYDHQEDAEAEEMEMRERVILSSASREGMPPMDFPKGGFEH